MSKKKKPKKKKRNRALLSVFQETLLDERILFNSLLVCSAMVVLRCALLRTYFVSPANTLLQKVKLNVANKTSLKKNILS